MQKKQAAHYLGYTNNLDSRIANHKAGLGARLLEVITADGIGFVVARTWTGDRKLERRLKNRKKAACLCPCCDPQRAARNGDKQQ